MYRVTIYNGGTATIIHEASTDPAEPHLYNATLTEGSPGEIDSVEFSILPNNPGYDLLYSRTTTITVLNTKTGLAEFKGRVLTVTPEMQDSGLIYKSVVCESRLGYLCDSVQPYTEEQTYALEDFFELLLENHNSQVEDYKKIYPGTISATASASTGNVTKGLNYQDTWTALKEKLLDTEGGELLLYDGTDGLMYLDYVSELGSRGEQTIELGVNMRSIKQEIDPTEVITRLIPLGAKLEDEDGNETEERLTIGSVNNGVIYLDDEEAQEVYGIVEGIVEWEDVTEASNLLTKAQNWLDNQTITDQITIDALDLSLLGLAEDSLEHYNYYRIINSAIGLDAYFRVVKRTVDLCDPSNITYEMGTQSKSVSSIVSSASKNAASAVDDTAALAAELSKTVASLIVANAEIASLSSIVATIESAYIDTATINTLLAAYATIETLETYYLTAEQIEASYVKTDELEADVAAFGYLKATDADFTDLVAAVATIESAYISTATVETLLADYVKSENLEADVASFGFVKATDTILTNLISQVAVIENAYITTERVNTLLADYVKTDELEADVATFGYLKATDAEFTDLAAAVATIESAYISAATVDTLLASYVKTSELEADVAEFGYLKTASLDAEAASLGYLKATDAEFTSLYADVATIMDAYISEATVNTLLANYVKTTELEADVAEFGYLKASELEAAVAEFGYVKTTYLETYYLTAEEIESAYVTADTLTASYIDADTIASTYIKADLTNFTTTMVGTLLADAGLVTSMTIQDGYVTGELSSVTINADTITTGTLSVERLIIIGEDGLIYQINAQSSGLSTSELTDETYQNYINGTVIVANSITATQIAAGAITATEIASNTITAEKMDVSELSSITADVGLLTAGILMSQNYVAGESGIYIDLDAGTIDCEELIVTVSERILLTASETYATLEDYSSLAASFDSAVVSVVAYFAISDSADEYPDLEAAGGTASYAGIARAGLWLAGYYGWVTEMPEYEDGDYVWLAYLKTYADGSTEWTEPALIVDGSVSERVVSVTETTAAIQVLADSILQVVASTNATWYTGDYVIAATSCGDPDTVGCDASLYEGLYYLDQTTGYVYLSDGTSWTYVDALASTTEAMQSMIEVAEGNIKSELTSYATITYADGVASDAQSAAESYADSAASDAESAANEYTDGKLSYYSTTETMTNAISQAITDSENSITSAISTTYATISYTDSKASDAQSAAESYADSAADAAESNANEYTDGKLVYYSTTETMTNAISQAITDSENSITSAISTTYATISYADSKASDAQSAAESYADSAASDAESAANEYTDGKLSYYSTTETMTNAISQAITDSTNAIMLDVSNTYATTQYAQDAADGALEQAKSYTSSTISASLALEILEAEDGTKYGALSANADYILLIGSQIEIETDDLTLSGGNAIFSGALEAASGTFAGELSAASGTFTGELVATSGTFGTITGGILMSENYVSGESGIYIDLDNGTIDCASLTASISDGLLLTVSQTYATLEDYSTLASTLDQAVVSVVAYFAISDSADKYPDLEVEASGGAASYAGVARAGLWLVGYTGWIPEMPVYDDGDYVWMSYLKTYADGSTEWTEPALIVDGSVSERVVSVTETTAAIQVLADSILQVVTSTNATWYTGDYVIAATSCGAPDEVGCAASSYNELYYLDQTTGYVYLSDGTSWEKVAELESTVSTMETLVTQTEESIKSTVSEWVGAVTVYYGTCASAAAYPYKTVECDSFDADSLVAGASIRITFANGNTAYPLLLNINGTGNIPAYVDGENFNADSDTWGENATAVFEYDGTVWNLVETGSYSYAQTLVEQTAKTWSTTLTENYATKASLALTLAEETDEDGTVHTYGTLSGYAEYIKFEAKQFVVDAGNFSIAADSTVTAGGFTIGESALYSGMESLTSEKDGVYVGTDGIGFHGDSGLLAVTSGVLTMRSNSGIVCTNSEGTKITADDKAYFTAKIGDGWGLSIYTAGYEDESTDPVGRFDISTDEMTASSASTSDWFTISNLSETVTVKGALGVHEALTVSGAGQIGDWTLNEYKLYSGASSLDSEENGVYISADTEGEDIGIRMNSDYGTMTLTPGGFEVKSTEEEVTTDEVTGYPFMKWTDGGLYLGVGDRSAAVCTSAHGTVESVSVSAGSRSSVDISFGTTFPGIPTVVACILGMSASDDGDYGNLTVSVRSSSVTDLGCTIIVSNAGSSSRSPGVSWVAMY